jgi:DNA primase small subunit
VDTHRLIRYPGSLHGKTGFKVQELTIKQMQEFNPLDQPDDETDPIVFFSKNNVTLKLEITEEEVPSIKIKNFSYGPYKKGEKIDVPHHIAIFLLCKGVAKIS